MSVQSQIDRINSIKQRIRTNLVAQGITVPEDTMLEEMAELILSVAGENGKDYVLTEADKSEIATLVIEMLGGNPIFGVVDENNNIIVSGDLPDGTYSVKYEMANGSTVNIGNLVLDTNVYYTVTNNLTNCTSNNSATKVVQGSAYSATITAKSGYELKSVSATMGGTSVSVSNGKINIANVTGNIAITAVAEEVQINPANLADPTSSDWLSGHRYSASSGTIKNDAASTVCVTNYIPVESGDVISISGGTVEYGHLAADANKNQLLIANNINGGNYWSYETNKFTILHNDVKFMRFTLSNVTNANDVIITASKG
jgi:hypothetical protein